MQPQSAAELTSAEFGLPRNEPNVSPNGFPGYELDRHNHAGIHGWYFLILQADVDDHRGRRLGHGLGLGLRHPAARPAYRSRPLPNVIRSCLTQIYLKIYWLYPHSGSFPPTPPENRAAYSSAPEELPFASNPVQSYPDERKLVLEGHKAKARLQHDFALHFFVNDSQVESEYVLACRIRSDARCSDFQESSSSTDISDES